MNHKDRMMQ